MEDHPSSRYLKLLPNVVSASILPNLGKTYLKSLGPGCSEKEHNIPRTYTICVQ